MTKAKADEPAVKAEQSVAETTNTETNPLSITLDDLMYLYTILINSNVPVRDLNFVNQLKQKLEVILKR
ncbi:MAG: hypothetical protein PHN69_05725 [Candidatus Pacebacteria bacterium]|nr:hypothetical protein [Candidatus Paceibacterota bacterium]